MESLILGQPLLPFPGKPRIHSETFFKAEKQEEEKEKGVFYLGELR